MKDKGSRRAKMHLKLNVGYELRDQDGNPKQIFTENRIGKAMLRFFRQLTDPIENGQVKQGALNYLAAYGLRLPYITGVWSDKRLVSNLITTVGKALVAGRINGSGSPAAATYIAVGTGTTAANVADTTLETEITDSGLERAAATASLEDTDTTDDTARLTKTFTVTGTKAVTESGVLNAASSGTLLARQVFSAVNVVNGDTLAVTWDFDVD
jgi:hypothetical protein